jgi:hypothetical protein
MPVPAGGIRLDSAAEVARFYGPDTMLLIGSDLQRDPTHLFARAQAFTTTLTGN